MRPLGVGWGGRTHCKHDHEFTPENTRTYRGYRVCLACAKRRQGAHVAKRHEFSRKSRRKNAAKTAGYNPLGKDEFHGPS